MKHLRFVLGFGLLTVVIFFGANAQESPTAETQPETAVQQVAREHGLDPAVLEVADHTVRSLDLTGETIYSTKVIDTLTGNLYAVTINQAGDARDLNAALDAERTAVRAERGSMTPELYEMVQSAAPEDKVEVAIWVAGDVTPLSPPDKPLGLITEVTEADGVEVDVAPRTSPSGEEVGEAPADAEPEMRTFPESDRESVLAFQARNREHVMSQVAILQAPIVNQLTELGHTPTYVSSAAPLIYVTVTKADLLTLSTQRDIETIYPVGQNDYQDLMDIAKGTHKADIVDDEFNFDGTGVSVGILEDSRVEFDNPYLNYGGTDLADSVRVPNDSNVDQHATATAGMVASLDSTIQGIAQDADLYSANGTTYSDSNMSNALDWATATKDLDVVNNSWGGNAGSTNLNVHDRHVDYLVRTYIDSYVIAAGNDSSPCGASTDIVGSPGKAYNAITVGNFNDGNTVGWSDDSMSTCSSFTDPSTGVGKPEVAASGSSIESTTDDPSDWLQNVGSGTSYAAPMVSGAVALMINRDASLSLHPPVVKAILMATALNNIEGSTRFSDLDGAGGVDMRAAFRVADEGWWSSNSVTSASFPYTETQYIEAGETVRAVIAWNSNPNSGYTTDPLEADIDMRVYAPNGSYVIGSTSVDNNFEIVEFTAAQSGNYKFRISDWAFNGSSETIGFAVWPGHDPLNAYSWETGNTPPVSRDHYRINASASGWHVVGLRPPAGGNYNLAHYPGTVFGDPDEANQLENSTWAGDTVDFVVIDRNHAPSQDYFLEVDVASGTGTYYLEWAERNQIITVDNTYGPFSLNSGDVVYTWDDYIGAGSTVYYKLQNNSTDLDLGLALFDSDPTDTDSYYQDRALAARRIDSNGAGGDESMNYTASASDYHGIVVWSKGGAAGDFNIHVCRSPFTPTADITYDPNVDTYANMSWTAGHESSTYRVRYSSTDAYFVGGSSFTTANTSNDINLNTWFLYVEEENPCDLTSAGSNRVGVFTFDITPGD